MLQDLHLNSFHQVSAFETRLEQNSRVLVVLQGDGGRPAAFSIATDARANELEHTSGSPRTRHVAAYVTARFGIVIENDATVVLVETSNERAVVGGYGSIERGNVTQRRRQGRTWFVEKLGLRRWSVEMTNARLV